jgi:putative lysine/arginine/ornithine/histidine/octopine transport system permease protein
MINLYGYGDLLLLGTWVTIKLIAVSLIFGLAFGLIGAGAKLSRYFILNALTDIITTIVRGLPELVVIFFVYYGSSIFLSKIGTLFGYDGFIGMSTFAAGVASLSSIFGSYATDVFRIAILSIPKGQKDAGLSTGMSRLLVFRRIVLPQVWRIAIPGLSNLILGLMKNTALVSVIGLYELMGNTALAVAYSKKPFTLYLFVAIIYLCLTCVAMIVLDNIERYTSRGYKKI